MEKIKTDCQRQTKWPIFSRCAIRDVAPLKPIQILFVESISNPRGVRVKINYFSVRPECMILHHICYFSDWLTFFLSKIQKENL